jgi:hypothetical protein
VSANLYEVMGRSRKVVAILNVLDDQRYLKGEDDAEALASMPDEWWDKVAFAACVFSPSLATRAAIIETVRWRR